MEKLIIGGIYQHFKGARYKILAFADHSEREERLVIYQSLPDGKIRARPQEMFLDLVEKEGRMVARFEQIKE